MPTTALPTLIDVARELNEIERAAVSCIMIRPATGGYEATFSVHLFLPSADDPQLPDGVKMSAVEHYPDAVRTLTWSIPAWDQVLEVINDPELSRSENFGRMEALEKSVVNGDQAAESESGKHWVISTHGLPRSTERKEWLARMMEGQLSASGTPDVRR